VEGLDFSTRVLINPRTGVRSNVVLALFVALAALASAVLFTTASRADNPETRPAPTVVQPATTTSASLATR
jgi:hypothetical protein